MLASAHTDRRTPTISRMPLAALLEDQQRAVKAGRGRADLAPLQQAQAVLLRQVRRQRLRAQLQAVQRRHRHALAPQADPVQDSAHLS